MHGSQKKKKRAVTELRTADFQTILRTGRPVTHNKSDYATKLRWISLLELEPIFPDHDARRR